MKQYRVGIIGGTGMVGQRFVTLMEGHPWFKLTAIAASAKSAGKTYEEAVSARWAMGTPIPEEAKGIVVLDAQADAEKIASMVDFVFCAVDMKKEEIRALEEKYARLECPVVSNNSAHRWTEDVPMVVPEINADHIRIIDSQRKRLGTKAGLHRREVQLLPPVLRPRPAPPAEVRAGKGPGLHLPGHLRGGQKPSSAGRRWWTTASPTSAGRRRRASGSP